MKNLWRDSLHNLLETEQALGLSCANDEHKLHQEYSKRRNLLVCNHQSQGYDQILNLYQSYFYLEMTQS